MRGVRRDEGEGAVIFFSRQPSADRCPARRAREVPRGEKNRVTGNTAASRSECGSQELVAALPASVSLLRLRDGDTLVYTASAPLRHAAVETIRRQLSECLDLERRRIRVLVVEGGTLSVLRDQRRRYRAATVGSRR
jgi:hypothetical protein